MVEVVHFYYNCFSCSESVCAKCIYMSPCVVHSGVYNVQCCFKDNKLALANYLRNQYYDLNCYFEVGTVAYLIKLAIRLCSAGNSTPETLGSGRHNHVNNTVLEVQSVLLSFTKDQLVIHALPWKNNSLFKLLS